MSIAGIASTALYSVLNDIQGQGQQNSGGNSQQFQSEFQQLGQDLQSGNLSQAQQDYATLSQDFPNVGGTGTSASSNPIAQAFSALSQALQNGNLSGAQQDYTTIQQDFQQQQQGANRVHHHHHHGGGGGEQDQVNQAFGSLASALQSGNLSGAQSAFATLQQDLEQFGMEDSSTTATGTPSAAGLSVTA